MPGIMNAIQCGDAALIAVTVSACKTHTHTHTLYIHLLLLTGDSENVMFCLAYCRTVFWACPWITILWNWHCSRYEPPFAVLCWWIQKVLGHFCTEGTSQLSEAFQVQFCIITWQQSRNIWRHWPPALLLSMAGSPQQYSNKRGSLC